MWRAYEKASPGSPRTTERKNRRIAGADDIPLAQVADPPLSTIAFDPEKVGRSLAQAVVASLSGRKPHLSPASLSPHVIHRAST